MRPAIIQNLAVVMALGIITLLIEIFVLRALLQRQIALPLARPGIVVSAILSFITSWNNFIFGAVFAGRTTRTMPVAVYNMLTFESFASFALS